MSATTAQMAATARNAGYETLQIEQPRANRWLLLLRLPDGSEVLVMAQRRRVLLAADVQDLAEVLRLRRIPRGYLLALDGRFSAEALRLSQELRVPQIRLCLSLPPAGAPPAMAGALEGAS